MLFRYHDGEAKVWRVVNMPKVEAEDSRKLYREPESLKAELTYHVNRLRGLLEGQPPVGGVPHAGSSQGLQEHHFVGGLIKVALASKQDNLAVLRKLPAETEGRCSPLRVELDKRVIHK